MLDLQRFTEETGGDPTPDAGEEMTEILSENNGAVEKKQDAIRNSEGKREEQTFEALLKGNPAYKSAYDAKIKKALEGRFRQARGMEETLARLEPVVKTLCQRRGISEQEPERLLEADRGAFDRVERQARQARQKYPALDLNQEMKNPQFGLLVARGVPVEAAYELAHRQELLGSAMAYAVRRAREDLAAGIQSAASRPSETGLGAQAAAVGELDPARLTKDQRKMVREKVARGERVTF